MNNLDFLQNDSQIIEDISMPAEPVQQPDNAEYTYNDYLIQRARQLGNNVQEILSNEAGGH
jgi:hypothetical protein